ncbi:hypothetical protein [Sporosarcina sp. NPDC096371]|uniref:hypothetical protein n=1 Tax=Sporosarcina sp. NPDC096371 TaxID=3364530 RepID=UPI00380AA17D
MNKESIQKDVMRNVNFLMNNNEKIQNRIALTNFKGTDVVKCKIFKSNEVQDIDKESVPLVHINTLAQMLYIAFYEKTQMKDNPIPLLFIFEPKLVEGAEMAGAYALDLQNDSFLLLKHINVEKLKEAVGENKPLLAIGYVLDDMSIQHLGNETLSKQIIEESENLALALDKVLDLHGELQGLLETTFQLKDLEIPLLFLQWIKEKV